MQSSSLSLDNSSRVTNSNLILSNESEMENAHNISSNSKSETDAADRRIHPDRTLNAVGLSCPMPLLSTKKEISNLSSSQILEVLSTCPGAKTSLPAWSKRAGHFFLGAREEGGILISYIQKG